MAAFEGFGNRDEFAQILSGASKRRESREQAFTGRLAQESDPFRAIGLAQGNKRSTGRQVGLALGDAFHEAMSPEIQQKFKMRGVEKEVEEWASDNGLDPAKDQEAILEHSVSVLKERGLGAEAGRFDEELNRIRTSKVTAAQTAAEAKSKIDLRTQQAKKAGAEAGGVASSVAQRKAKTQQIRQEILKSSVMSGLEMQEKELDVYAKYIDNIDAHRKVTLALENKIDPQSLSGNNLTAYMYRNGSKELRKAIEDVGTDFGTRGTKGTKPVKAAIQKVVNKNILARLTQASDLPYDIDDLDSIDTEAEMNAKVAELTSKVTALMAREGLDQTAAENRVLEEFLKPSGSGSDVQSAADAILSQSL